MGKWSREGRRYWPTVRMSTPRPPRSRNTSTSSAARFAQSNHHAALRHHARREFFGVLEQSERAFVASTRANCAIQTRHGLDVAVQNLRLRRHYDQQRLFNTLKVRRQNLYPAPRSLHPYLFDHTPQTPALRQHCRHRDSRWSRRHEQAPTGTAKRYSPRLIEINRLRLTLRHGTEPAAPRAKVSQHHERRRL